MRIGVSTSAIQRGESPEGRYTLGLVRALLAEATAHELVLFVLEADLPLFAFARAGSRIVPISEAYRPPVRDVLWHQLTLPRLAQDLGLDVLHLPTQRRLLWPKPCGLVATIDDAPPAGDSSSPTTVGREHFVLRRLVGRQDELVAVTRTAADRFARQFEVPLERITVIHNGIDHARFSAVPRERAAAAIAKEHGVHPPFFLCVVPLSHPEGNHTRLIRAFSLFKTAMPSPWQLVLLGRDGRGAGHIHEAIRRSPYAQDIRCVGHTAMADLARWYSAAGALAHVPLHDNASHAPLEAMACECPVLAAQHGATRELAGEAALLTDADDLAALHRDLARMAGNVELRQQLRAKGLDHAAKFDWRRTAAATLEIYARAAQRAKQPVLAPTPLTRPAH